MTASPEPISHADETPLQVVTASVSLTLNLNGQRAVIDICRLAREPHWALKLWEQPEGEITLTRNDEIEPEYAAFNLTIAKPVDGGR